jgi:hypothetical protein
VKAAPLDIKIGMPTRRMIYLYRHNKLYRVYFSLGEESSRLGLTSVCSHVLYMMGVLINPIHVYK